MLIVVLASGASTGLVMFIFRRDVRRYPQRILVAGLMVWFLVCYGAAAFLVRPY